MTETKKRNANIELLRIISMIMIIFLHALSKGENLKSLTEGNAVNAAIAWTFEALSISSVNIFILISGYFLIDSKFKIRRLISLVAQCIFYSLGTLLVCLIFNIDVGEEINLYFILHAIFPVHMKLYWFMTSYIVIYMLQPLISFGVKALTQKQFGTMIIALLIYECFFKSFLPFSFMEDEAGYSMLWFLIVFLIGAYFKLYGFKHLTNPYRGALLYFAASFLILFECGAIGFVNEKFSRLYEISRVSMDYNHMFPLFASVGIFACFLNKKPMGEKASKIICFLSPMALGVYLCHENLCMRYNWVKWLGIYDILGLSTMEFLGRLMLAVLIVYAAGTIIDFVRIKIFKFIEL